MRHQLSKKQTKAYRLRGLIVPAILIMTLVGCTESSKTVTPPPASAPVQKQQPIVSAATKTADQKIEEKGPVYAYVPAGRRDPFAPIIIKETKKGKTGDRPPLERYSINEFKLSGIIWGGFGYNAILEAPDGKGYFVRVGTVLGPNGGVIRKITQTSLVVEEKFKNYAGESERKEFIKQLVSRQEEKP